MRPVKEDLETLVSAYLRDARAPLDAEADRWAWEKVLRLVFTKPEEAWSVIVRGLERAGSLRELRHLAAGPIEDLIHFHPAFGVEKLEAEVRGNARLRWALEHVWIDDEEVSAVWRSRIGLLKEQIPVPEPPFPQEESHEGQEDHGVR